MSTVHVVPLDDVVEHEVPGGLDGQEDAPGGWLSIEAGDGDDLICACGPHAECIRRADLPDGWVITHHSLDGREHRE